MKSDKLQDAMGYIKDEYIAEAHAESASKPAETKKVYAGRKRWISLVAAAACIMVVVTGGVISLKNEGMLGNKGTVNESAASDYQDSGNSKNYGGESASVVNPLQESSAAEIERADGVRIVLPDGAKDAVWTRINADPVIDQADFVYKGREYTYRVSKTGKEEDISGMYFDWKTHIIADSGTADEGYSIDMNKGAEGVIRWHSDGYTYSISVTDGASEKRLYNMYSMLKNGTSIVK